MLQEDLDESHREAEELDEGDDGGTEGEPKPTSDGGCNKDERNHEPGLNREPVD